MNKKGFTVVELVVSLALVSIILVFLFQVIIQLKDLYTFDNTKTGILRQNAMLTDELNSYLDTNIIDSITRSGNTVTFTSTNGSNVTLNVNDKDVIFSGKKFTYNTKLSLKEFKVEYINGLINTSSGIFSIKLEAVDDDGNKYPYNYMHDFRKGMNSESNASFIFDFTGSVQEFIAPKTGNYKIEAWGAEGNTIFDGIPGKGGYATGTIHLNENQRLYVCIGGHNGYNGGREGNYLPGGGATSITTVNRGTLNNFGSYINEIIIVAGGGGAAERITGGSGGGIQGSDGSGTYESVTANGKGGTQSSGGAKGSSTNSSGETAGSFGLGGSGNATGGVGDSASSGGGGFYGGGGVTYAGGAGGGSGYIGNSSLTNKYMTGYNVITSNNATTKTTSTSCANSLALKDCSKLGNGYAKITLS